MSSKALTWAWEQHVTPATMKFILVAMAELANYETALCYPSIAALETMTGLNRKTILSSMAKLVDEGFLSDTGKTTGRTNQIKVYRFTFGTDREGENQTVPKSGPLKSGGEQSRFYREESQFFREESQKRDTEPSNRNLEGRDSPLSLTGEATPNDEDLFGGKNLPAVIGPPIEQYVQAEWQKLKAEFPRIQAIRVLTPDRTKKIRARAAMVVREAAGALTEQQVWDIILQGIRRDPFLRGEGPIGQGYSKAFAVDIDYVLRQREFLKIIERHDDDAADHRSDQFDAGTGRRYGPAELAARRLLASMGRDQE